jgi:hypothetical protein
MGQAIPSQHPAVVLRSHYNHMRALLAVAMIALVGLTAAVVILAADSDEVSGTSSATPIESINYGSGSVNPSTGYPSATIRPDSPGTRYDGGPEEGTADVSTSQPRVTQSQAFPGLAHEANAAQADERRYDGGPEEGTADVSASQPRVTESRAFPGLASEAKSAQADEPRYDGGPEEGTRGSGH